jgi:hypothetical protein
MSAVDRILRAYAGKYRLTAEQAGVARKELAAFVARLSSEVSHSPEVSRSPVAKDGCPGKAEPGI